MFLSIRKIFFNLKVMLSIVCAGIVLLTVQLFHISEYGERLGALKNQHRLIEKIINTDLNDPQMGSILVNGAVAEIELSVKLSGEETLLDRFFTSNEEQASLLRSLTISSKTFREVALAWAESTQLHQQLERERMMNARSAYLSDIDRMVDYQIHVITETITTAKISSIMVAIIALSVLYFYRLRLNQVYSDIEQAYAIDTNGKSKEVKTEEIDFIIKRLKRRTAGPASNPILTHPLTGLHNEKGLISAYNAKISTKTWSTVFLALFEIDHRSSILETLSVEDQNSVYSKLAEIIKMFEQPSDIIAHLDDNRILFLMSRNTKNAALDECQNIIQIVQESTFLSENGPIKITLSAGFLLKPPAKSIEEGIKDALSLIANAQENGGNRVAHLRERTDPFRQS